MRKLFSLFTYVFFIQASDTDPTDPRIKTATATITILDVNDNPPVFNQAEYETAVSENHPSNYLVSRFN